MIADMDAMIRQLVDHEGERLKPYRCTAGKLTIGVGRNLDDAGISVDESRMLLKNDIDACCIDLSRMLFPRQFGSFPELIQRVLVDMRFQLGRKGFRSFKGMIVAFQAYDYRDAIREMKNSLWYRQCPNRADNLIRMVREAAENNIII